MRPAGLGAGQDLLHIAVAEGRPEALVQLLAAVATAPENAAKRP